jgi:preprotein translocase subunit SecD
LAVDEREVMATTPHARLAVAATAVLVGVTSAGLTGCGSDNKPKVYGPGTTFGPSTVQIAKVSKIRTDKPCTDSVPSTGKYCGTDRREYDIETNTLHDLRVLTAATRQVSDTEFVVDVQLDKTSTEYLNQLTRDFFATDTKLAIIADDKVVTAAPVDAPIETGQFRILVPKGQNPSDLARQLGG